VPRTRGRLAGAGALATLAVLLWRGPDDWSRTSHSLTLYRLPVLVMGVAIALAILDLARQDLHNPATDCGDCGSDSTQLTPPGRDRLTNEANYVVRQRTGPTHQYARVTRAVERDAVLACDQRVITAPTHVVLLTAARE